MNLGKFDCSTGLVNILYEDKLKDKRMENREIQKKVMASLETNDKNPDDSDTEIVEY